MTPGAHPVVVAELSLLAAAVRRRSRRRRPDAAVHRRPDDRDWRLAAGFRRPRSRTGRSTCGFRWRCRPKSGRGRREPGIPRSSTTLADRRAADMIVVGRLRRGVSIGRPSNRSPPACSGSSKRADPRRRNAEHRRQRVRLEPAATGIGLTRRQYQTSLRVMMAVTAAVLLIACLNLANLDAGAGRPRGRASSRCGRRSAPDPGRLVRQLLAENLVLSRRRRGRGRAPGLSGIGAAAAPDVGRRHRTRCSTERQSGRCSSSTR